MSRVTDDLHERTERRQDLPADAPVAGTATHVDLDRDGWYVDAPPEALDLFGVSLDELRRHRVGDFAPHGLGPIHRALFLWVARQGEDFGGGRSIVVSPDGRETPIDCTAIRPHGDRYRAELRVRDEESAAPRTDTIASVLEAWRQAERRMASATESDEDYDLARRAAEALRDVYHAIAAEKAVAGSRSSDGS